MQDLYKFSMDGLVFSQQVFPGANEAGVAAYLLGCIRDDELAEGVSVYIGRVIPLRIDINIDTLLADIQNDLSEFISHGLNITLTDKIHLQEYISKYIMDRNPGLHETKYVGSVWVNREFVNKHKLTMQR